MRSVVGFTRIVFSALCLLPLAVQSGPFFLEESAKLFLPEEFPYRLDDMSPPAVDGDSIVLIGFQVTPDEAEIRHAAILFERNAANGTWSLVSTLLETRQQFNREFDFAVMTAAMEGNRLVVSGREDVAGATTIRRVYERGPTGWVHVADLVAPPDVQDQGWDAEIDGSTIVLGNNRPETGGSAYRKNAQGEWSYIGSALGPDACDSDFCTGPDLDLSGNTMVFSLQHLSDGGAHAPHVQIWDYLGGTLWSHATSVVPDPARPIRVSGPVAIEGDTVLVGGLDQAVSNISNTMSTNFREYARTGAGWSLVDEVRTVDSFNNGWDVAGVELEGGLAVVSFPHDRIRGEQTGSAAVFRRNASGRFEEVARLVTSDAATRQLGVGRQVDISGTRIVAIGLGAASHGDIAQAAYVFDLPANLIQPDRVQHDFEDGNSAGWTPLPGSMWSVVTSGGSKVFRQSNFGSVLDGAILGNTDWTNQAIEADVTPTAISGSDRWVGLAVRHTDANNYYYVTLRSSHTIQLRRMLNGSFVSLASASHAVALNHTYRLRLEAIGTWLRVYLDGKLVVEARDSTLSHGQAALLSFKTQADFDNAIVSANPGLTLLEDRFDSQEPHKWSPGLTSDWAITIDGSSRVYSQRSTAGDARSVSGISTGDQIIHTRAKATAFNGPDRWFGLMTRFVDDQNYYYVTIRNSNQIALRKLVNGAFTVLDTAPMTVSTGTWYNLRMESVGSKHRVYVNDFLVLEADDATHATGRYGFRTFKTAASYDDFTAMKP